MLGMPVIGLRSLRAAQANEIVDRTGRTRVRAWQDTFSDTGSSNAIYDNYGLQLIRSRTNLERSMTPVNGANKEKNYLGYVHACSSMKFIKPPFLSLVS